MKKNFMEIFISFINTFHKCIYLNYSKSFRLFGGFLLRLENFSLSGEQLV